MQKFKHAFVLALIGGIVCNNIVVCAQRPPTGGPNPKPTEKENTSIPVFIYPVAGVALAAATYYLVKKRPPKLPVPESLHTYLLARHILPSPDALALMFALNPKLRGRDAMRSTRKLAAPDFPPVPTTLVPVPSAVLPNPSLLTKQMALFREYRLSFNAKRLAVKASDTSLDKLKKLLADLEQQLSVSGHLRDGSSPVITAMSNNLLQVINQTLRRSISSGTVGEQDASLLLEVSDNLTELMSAGNIGPGKPGGQGREYRPPGVPEIRYAAVQPGNARKYPLFTAQATARPWELGIAEPDRGSPVPAAENMEQVFAFAIYKIDAQGHAITKGPEVEGKYFIQYVPPALKAFENYYHSISPPPATYAAAKLPPAKFYLIVKDLQGNKVTLQNPLIDTRDIFRNPQRDYFKEMILVTIYVSP